MASESSFDIALTINHQEVGNVLNQAPEEIGTRFDFRGVGASIDWSGGQAIASKANSEERANAVPDVFKDKLVKRQVSLKVLDAGDPRLSGNDPRLSGKEYRLTVSPKEGTSQDDAKKLGKITRDERPKGIKTQIQGDELRRSSKKKKKKKKNLRDVITLLKSLEFDFALQFVTAASPHGDRSAA